VRGVPDHSNHREPLESSAVQPGVDLRILVLLAGDEMAALSANQLANAPHRASDVSG
jgi:hypothetical protein